jgi:hypothetical protein
MANPLDDIKAVQSELQAERRPKRQHPEGWEPGVTWNGNEGTVTTTGMPAENAPDWDTVLKVWGLDPSKFEVVEPVLFNVWGDTLGVLNRQWKGKVVRKTAEMGADVQEMIEEIRKHKFSKPEVSSDGSAMVVAISDLQLGKGENGGSAKIVERFLAGINEVESRWKELRKLGTPLSRLVVVGLGDIIENCDGHYDMQAFQADLDRREQVTVARRLITKALTQWSKFAPEVIVACVPGNHGENRKGGKAFTSFGDNDDVAVFEQVAEILAANPDAYGHVKFIIPKNDLTVTLDVYGTIVALAHGHQARRGGGGPVGKIESWWARQALGMQPVSDATLLLTGHYHHLVVATHGARTHIQAPSLDGGSQWYKEVAGVDAPVGILTLVVNGSGWDDLKVLKCKIN